MALVETTPTPFGVIEGLEIPGLARNSTISVTIDDLAEGLLVVSFAHSDNLYQGVLFQLNRERGIPSGISFAKEQALGSGSTPDKVDGDILVAQPLHKRHSYNPGSSCSTSLSSRMQSSLRRIIKRPDRFKNSAMSLRLRTRPVLCAKCRSLCDDKSDSSTGNDPPKDGTPTEKSRGKGRPPKQGAFPAINGKLTGAQQQSATSEVAADTDPQDLTYESVGSSGVIANYWKRPLVQPLIPSSEETYSRLRKHKLNLDPSHPRNKRKRTTTMSCISNRGTVNQSARTVATPYKSDAQGMEKQCSKNNEEEPSEPFPTSEARNLFICRSASCDNDVPITRRRKELSLKMCITKITDLRNGDCTKSEEKNSSSENNSSEKEQQDDDTFRLLPQNGAGPGETSNEYGKMRRVQKKKPGRPSKKANKEWGNRMRATSNVPARYREEGSLANNVFNFNKRRSPDTDETPVVLTISRDDDAANAFKVSNLTEVMDNCDDAGDKEHDENSQTPPRPSSSSLSTEEFDEKSRDNSESSMIRTPQSLGSSSSHEGTARLKSTASKPPEIMKTPTIKITFGTSGNGMVVQIPPKLAQNADLESADAKAAKKAMKKARKEAKRKRSASPLHSPSFDAFSPDSNSLKSERSQPSFPNVPSHHLAIHNASNPSPVESSPSPPSPSLLEPPAQPSESSELITKRKKQKKRRRSSKNLKENDDFGISNNCNELSRSMSSSVSSSTHIQDCANHELGPSSPQPMPAKSVGFESISNPGTPDPLLSFSIDPPPPRRRSVPVSSSTSSDTPRRVCINLKRVDTNAYVPLPKLQSISCQGEEDEESSSVTENNGAETDDCDSSEVSLIGSSNGSETGVGALTSESVDYYKDTGTECIYRKGDIVWGKLPAWPWWPGKISNIVQYSSDETYADISWFKSKTQSSVPFEMLVPFTQYYDCKYEKHRRRGAYQAAVNAAMLEANKLNSEEVNSQTDPH